MLCHIFLAYFPCFVGDGRLMCVLFSNLDIVTMPFKANLRHYSRTPLIWINWDDEPSGYAENLDNCIFIGK